MDDSTKVLQANAAFYKAFSSKDLTLMESVWLHSDSVKCIHPGWHLIVGWQDVSETWKTIFDSGGLFHAEALDEEAYVIGDVAWVICTENLTHKMRDEIVTGAAQTTNIYERVGGVWLLTHHHASPAPSQAIREDLLQ